jgi:hypothetical protein
MEEIRPTHAYRPLISVDHKYSLSLSLVLLSLSYLLMFRWCRDRRTGQILNLLLGFCCFGLMIFSDWATEFLLFKFDGRRIGFFFFLVWFLATGFLLFWFFESNVIRFFPFWVFVSLVWRVGIRRLGDCQSWPGCTPEISYIYDIGRKKKV